ncbi:MAG: glutamine amidotransferase family protein [Firmicutes bacterium]|nr:glutamine amidotransferase family protein [Bacillota bacterium]
MLKEGEIRIPSGCAISGIINRNKELMNCSNIVSSMALMRERSNGLGGGFASYGIYPAYSKYYALHLFYDNQQARHQVEPELHKSFDIIHSEEIKTRRTRQVRTSPIIYRYFAKPRLLFEDDNEEDLVVSIIMQLNSQNNGAYVFSSGKNMGSFKGVGYPEDIAEFYCLEDYRGYIWTAHGRFPTNTPGWWGGAHPFCLLDWSVVHNGELSSYGNNRAYLEMFGYNCALQTDTEVVAYTFDLLVRRHGLSMEHAVNCVCPPFWAQIARMDGEKAAVMKSLRVVYGNALLNGPFSIVLATGRGMMGLNDRIKLRPLVAATKGDVLAVSSEESAVRVLCPEPEQVWQPEGGHPALGLVKGETSLWA